MTGHDTSTTTAAEHLDRLRVMILALWETDTPPAAQDAMLAEIDALATLAAPATDSGDDNAHLAAIIAALDADQAGGWNRNEIRHSIRHHADALAADNAALRARVAEAEARVVRWEAHYLAARSKDTPMTDWMARVDRAEAQLRKHGDLPDAKDGDA